MNTPECRYFLPAEWSAQDAILLTWPHSDSPWKRHLAAVEAVFCDIVRHVSQRQLLLIVYRDATQLAHIQGLLRQAGADAGRLRYAQANSDDSWARDHGPITVLCGGEPLLLDFRFNGWGGKFPAQQDDAITATLSAASAFGHTPLQRVDMVLEGGALEVDGSGSLLATETSVLSNSRNPGMTRAQIETRLKELLGLTRILWLRHGTLAGDDTDGHIDTLARFCDPQTIVYCHCQDSKDEHYDELQAMEQELRALRSISGVPYRLLPLPLPQAIHNATGQRLPASYANFLIINDAVLVPVYRDAADAQALDTLRECFPGREIIAINGLPLIQQYGSLHCITMQLPAGVLAAD